MQNIQILGIVGAASYAIARVAMRSGLLRYYRFAVVAVPVEKMPAMPAGFTVRELSAADLDGRWVNAREDVKVDRFAQGMVCLGAFNRKGKLVGVTWLGQQPVQEDDVAVRFAMRDDTCWDTGLWIDPDHRIGRAFPALWAGTAEWMRARGLRWSVSRILDYNLPSVLSHRRLGAVVLCHRVFVKLGSWQFGGAARPRLVRHEHGVSTVDLTRLMPG